MVFDFNNFERAPRSHKEKQISIDLLGLVNGPLKIKKCKSGSTNQRVPVILPDRTQCLLEIWTPKNCRTPEFETKWEALQMIIVTDLSYAGNIMINNKIVKVLRLPLYGAKTKRFIWLSGSRFWEFPLEVEKDKGYLKDLLSSAWPEMPVFDGFLKASEGSVITKSWAKIYPKVHTNTIEPFDFQSVVKFQVKVRQSLRSYVNLYTQKSATHSLVFER